MHQKEKVEENGLKCLFCLRSKSASRTPYVALSAMSAALPYATPTIAQYMLEARPDALICLMALFPRADLIHRDSLVPWQAIDDVSE